MEEILLSAKDKEPNPEDVSFRLLLTLNDLAEARISYMERSVSEVTEKMLDAKLKSKIQELQPVLDHNWTSNNIIKSMILSAKKGER